MRLDETVANFGNFLHGSATNYVWINELQSSRLVAQCIKGRFGANYGGGNFSIGGKFSNGSRHAAYCGPSASPAKLVSSRPLGYDP